MTKQNRARVAGMAGFVLALHLLGWGLLLLAVVPGGYHIGPADVFGVGLGVTAYLLGARHAFDADHVAAIDNTTRKLMSEGRTAPTVGFWFALGHSTVVIGLCVLLVFGAQALAGPVADDGSALHNTTGVIGSLVSGMFLLLIGLVNLLALRHILRMVRRMRRGEYDDAELERRLDERGFLARLLRGVIGRIREPTHMYPLGFLFGLGFDTATEVSLLILAGGAAAGRLPWFAILTLPVLFTAGMTLFDGLNGFVMTYAYGWSYASPARKVYYNLVITGLSVAIALLIGGHQLVGLLAERLHVTDGPPAWIAGLDLGTLGFVIVGMFLLTWIAAVTVWRFGKVEQRWAPRSPAE
ncbi:HoxN/HupN/NixA family nickel/cobalt transporter [Amycolatopsis sp. EV170708-02-1]|uniref:HoxN/HupN/NixA family nickel/cobalt transporter n=1 Tax=Amycolatopsis sp. EV170708-02-1 TaxID=2919322 RepID=UPI001F0BB448|nr:HoxN/HupN/NixA family nickel/cobalt transporter [Amycolatopsis sp. EV170708-02-1]UMP03428.1 HoxN/HupN/NixA family nickel/cobalt transporter [Amycolatopsis sp. EV170708-02-1]